MTTLQVAPRFGLFLKKDLKLFTNGLEYVIASSIIEAARISRDDTEGWRDLDPSTPLEFRHPDAHVQTKTAGELVSEAGRAGYLGNSIYISLI